MSAQELDVLWTPTFGEFDRWKCFMRSPYTLFVTNALVTIIIFFLLLIGLLDIRLLQPQNQPQRDQRDGVPVAPPEMDSSVLGPWFFHGMWYFFLACIIREAIQFCVELIQTESAIEAVQEYLDLWNIADLASPLCYFIGYRLHKSCLSDLSNDLSPSDSSMCSWKDRIGGSFISAWGTFYAGAVFFSCVRVLRVFYVTEIGVIINIFLVNFRDMFKFAVIYIVLICGLSAFFMGTAEYASLVPGVCVNDTTSSTQGQLFTESESGVISCDVSYAFVRPIFQSFGEFALGEISNSASITLVVITFVILNLMLMNLLIAMMTSTYETKSARATETLLLYKYQLLVEHSRMVVALPVPLNFPVMLSEAVYFFLQRKALKKLYPDCSTGQRLDMFLSRNVRPSKAIDNSDTSKDRKVQARISAFLERARAVVINKAPAKDSLDGKVDSMASDIKHIQEVSEGIRIQASTLHGKGGQSGRSQKAQERSREAAQQRIARLREKGFEQGKQALTVKKLIGEDQWDDPHFFSRKRPVLAYDGQDHDEDDQDYLKQLEAENKALRATNSRLITLLDQKSVETLSNFERRTASDDPRTFDSGERIALGRKKRHCVREGRTKVPQSRRKSQGSVPDRESLNLFLARLVTLT